MSDFYTQAQVRNEADLSHIQRRYLLISNARLVVFLAGIGLAYFLFRANFWAGMGFSIVALLGFMYLLKRHSEVADQRDHLRRQRRILREEIDALNWKYEGFEAGKDQIDPHHSFSYDLDLFGPRSLFQYLNRSGTETGRSQLISWLTDLEQDASVIRERQAAVQELAQLPEWLLNVQSLARAHRSTQQEVDSLLTWLQTPPRFSRSPFYRALVISMTLVFWLSVLAWLIPDAPGLREVFNGWYLPGWIPGILFFVNLGIVGLHLKETNAQHQQIGRKARLLNTYSKLMREIEQQPFKTTRLQELQHQLNWGEGRASDIIAGLSDLAYRFDQRLNMVAGIILNGTTLWDLRYLMRFERWRSAHRDVVPTWFKGIGEIDALLSLARLAFNRPDLSWPTLDEGEFTYQAEGLGHPLLDPDVRIDNDVSWTQPGEFLIVTGANMAGKSTFLRSVGVSLVMGMAGAPVCARQLRMVPVPMITSVRAADSLADNESYFYAELKQLKVIIDLLKAEGPHFVIVDEMLRGTNSRDKQVGSRRFIEQLLRLRGVGLVATHDLSLGTLAEEYPSQVRNKRFEVDITDDKLTFDYRLRDGISQNLNATFLMQQMGIMPKE